MSKFVSLTLPPLPNTPRLYQTILVAGIVILGLMIAWLPLKLTGLLLGGAVFAVLLLRYPLLGVYLLIPVIPFSALITISLGGINVGLMELLLAATLAAWLLQELVRHTYPASISTPHLRRGTPPLLWAFLLFAGCAMVSWLNIFSISAGVVETIKWIEMLALYIFITMALPRPHIKWITAAILLTGIAQALLGVYQFIFKVGPEGFLLFGGRFLRAYGTFAQPNPYAGYLGLILPLALALSLWAIIIFTQQKHLLRQKANIFLTTLALVSFGLILAALFASQSRSAWISFAIAALVTVIAYSKKPAVIVAGLVLAGSLLFFTNAVNLGLTQQTSQNIILQRFVDALDIINITDISTLEVNDANFSTVERLAHWQAAREMWRDNLWIGVGFGNYAAIYPAYAVGRWLDPLGHAHNYLLNLGAETGLLGIVGYLIFWIAAFTVSWLAVRGSSGFYRAVAAGGIGVLAHLQIHNLFDNLYVQGMYLHVAIILALLSIIYLCPKEENLQ